MNTTTKTATKAMKTSYPFLTKGQIAAKLAADPGYRALCLTTLYALQTAHEQATETTLNRNRQGFMSSHAVHGSRIAKKILAREELTAEDVAKIDEIVPRYTRQLAAHYRAEALAENPDLAAAAAIFGV